MDSGLDSGLDSGSTEDYETDVELLKRAWRQEKAAPEILQFESALVRRITEQIQLMVNFPKSKTNKTLISVIYCHA